MALTDRATQCLTSSNLISNRVGRHRAGPDLTVGSVTINAKPASFTFVQPTYPGDPAGPDDPDPAAHEASQTDPVAGPNHNPLPSRLFARASPPPPCRPTASTAPRARPTNSPLRRSHPSESGARPSPWSSTTPVVGDPSRRRRDHRRVVPVERRRLLHHRAGGERGLDAPQRLPHGEAHLRLLRHRGSGLTAGGDESGFDHTEPGRRRIPPRFGDLALEVGGPVANYLVEDSVGTTAQPAAGV